MAYQQNDSDYYIRLGMINDPEYRMIIENNYPADHPLRKPFTADEIEAATGSRPTDSELASKKSAPKTASLPADIIEALQVARVRQQLSQAALAKAANMSQSSVARIEEGKISPSLKTLQRLTDALGLKLTLQQRRP